jgi:hypothetical protein
MPLQSYISNLRAPEECRLTVGGPPSRLELNGFDTRGGASQRRRLAVITVADRHFDDDGGRWGIVLVVVYKVYVM